MSLGGALGGIFASLIAPKLFSEVLGVSAAAGADVRLPAGCAETQQSGGDLQKLALIAVAATGGDFRAAMGCHQDRPRLRRVGHHAVHRGAAGGGHHRLLATTPPLQLAAALAMFAAVAILPSNVHRGKAERSYFGVYRVVLSEDGEYNVLQHGTTLHGAQHIGGPDGQNDPRYDALHLLPPEGPDGAGDRHIAHAGWPRRTRRVASASSASAPARSPAIRTRTRRGAFIEIDPVVERHRQVEALHVPRQLPAEGRRRHRRRAADARQGEGRELRRAGGRRVLIRRHPDASHHRRGLQLYASKLAPDGLGVLHVSNRYLDLESVLSATLPQVPELRALAIDDPSRSDGYKVTPSSVVFISKDQRVLHQYLRMRGSRTLNWSDLKPWTDDTSDIIGPFLARWRRHG